MPGSSVTVKASNGKIYTILASWKTNAQSCEFSGFCTTQRRWGIALVKAPPGASVALRAGAACGSGGVQWRRG